MNKLALSCICIGALLVPNICSAEDSESVAYFDPLSSFKLDVKAPSFKAAAEKEAADNEKKQAEGKAKTTLASAH